ncbi:MAG: DUF4833 domain-containing protein [Elusimicrobia bacterium]|nr:DUF4833 domain-containing protein [Elusimicrobiota bacterium]
MKAGAGDMGGARLFVIERGKNANIVRYDAVQDPDGALLPEAPVRAYWVLLAEDGRTKELGWLERKKAYGFDVAPGPEAGSYLLRLAASPERRFLLRRSGGRPRVETVIDGAPAVLEKIYVGSSEGAWGLRVDYVDLFGRRPGTGSACKERIKLR